MLNKTIEEIKKEIDEKYNEKIAYENFVDKKNNIFDFEENKYSFETLILKTKKDNREILRFIYSVKKNGCEIINEYDNFSKEFLHDLLDKSIFPKNQHIISQNMLRQWIEPKNSYYITQNDYNGKVVPSDAKGTSSFASEYNVFTRFIGNKIITIENGLFKYVDESFDFFGDVAKKTELIDNDKKNSKKLITKKSELYIRIINVYRFFSIYMKHSKGIKSTENKHIDFLINELMSFENIKTDLSDTFSWLVSEKYSKILINGDTYLKYLFNYDMFMSTITLSKKSKFSFPIGINWGIHSQITIKKQNFYYIVMPISPKTAVIIYKTTDNIDKFVKDDYYLNILMHQNMLQYLSYIKIEKGVRILIKGKENYERYKNKFEEKGGFNHLDKYIKYDVVDKSFIDLLNDDIDLSIIGHAQNIYNLIETQYNKEGATFFTNIYNGELVKEINILSFDKNGNPITEDLFFNKIGLLEKKIVKKGLPT
jgi:hypothetical protein